MKEHHKKNIEAYDRAARGLAQTYNGLAVEDVLPGLAVRLPQPAQGRRALDLGCGAGRDAFWLAARGFEVVAVDASAQMLAYARRDKAHERVRYMRDMLPEIKKVRREGGLFDFILLSAVWMHLQPRERHVLMNHIAALAAPGALVYISLRHGEAPADRPMFANEAAEVERLGKAKGAQFERVGGDDDKQGRGGVKWEYVTLRF